MFRTSRPELELARGWGGGCGTRKATRGKMAGPAPGKVVKMVWFSAWMTFAGRRELVGRLSMNTSNCRLPASHLATPHNTQPRRPHARCRSRVNKTHTRDKKTLRNTRISQQFFTCELDRSPLSLSEVSGHVKLRSEKK